MKHRVSTLLMPLVMSVAEPALSQVPPPVATSPPRSPYLLSREEEDWSFLRDASVSAARRRTNAGRFDPVKYIPIGEDERNYLSLGGEIRPYLEGFTNENWGATPAPRDVYLLQRYMFHADLHVAESRFRAFVQLKTGAVTGREGMTRPPDRDDFDVNQAFIDIRPLSQSNAVQTVIRLGRQELNYGAGRMISVREGPNVRVGFDGARLLLRSGHGWQADLFYTLPVQTSPRSLDDRTSSGNTLWGVYASALFPAPHGVTSRTRWDIYFLGSERRMARFTQGSAPERRYSAGGRVSGGRKGARGETDYDLEITYQFGKFGTGAIRAGSVAGVVGHSFSRATWRPRVGIDFGITTGDNDPDSRDLGTFAPPAPRGSYFGQIGANGPQNSIGFSPVATLAPQTHLSVTASYYQFWRQSVRDGLYGVPGNLLRNGANGGARYVGSQPQIAFVWQADPQTSVTLNYARFFAGQFLRDNPPSRDISYYAAWVTYRF